MAGTRLVVIHNLNILWSFGRPPEAHAELVVDANAMQPGEIALKCLQPVSRRYSEIVKSAGTVQHGQFAHRHGFDIHETPDARAIEQAFGVRGLEGPDRHGEY